MPSQMILGIDTTGIPRMVHLSSVREIVFICLLRLFWALQDSSARGPLSAHGYPYIPSSLYHDDDNRVRTATAL